MIDHRARNRLAEEIRHFIGCFKDNFEYDDAVFDIDTRDLGVIEIRQSIWLTYDDLRRHKMNGEWALTTKQTEIIKRCIVFLKSNYEYKWLKWPLYYKAARPFVWLLSFGQLTEKLDKDFNRNGDLEAWPFFSKEEYEAAKKKPSYSIKIHSSGD
jgi:hypothetical protein